MTKEEAKKLIEKRKDLESEITKLERETIPKDMPLVQLYGKLVRLQSLYYQHRALSEEIKVVERLAKIPVSKGKSNA